jgi:hypothetical protein
MQRSSHDITVDRYGDRAQRVLPSVLAGKDQLRTASDSARRSLQGHVGGDCPAGATNRSRSEKNNCRQIPGHQITHRRPQKRNFEITAARRAKIANSVKLLLCREVQRFKCEADRTCGDLAAA